MTIEHIMKPVDIIPEQRKGGKPSKYDGVVDAFIESGHKHAEFEFPEVEKLETEKEQKKRVQAIRNAIKKRVDVRELKVNVTYQGTKIYLSTLEG